MRNNVRISVLFLLAGLVFLTLGHLCTPENLLRLEIGENALLSDNPLIREGARFEVVAARALAYGLGAALILIIPFLPRLRASRRYQAFMSRQRPSLRIHKSFRRRWLTPSLLIILFGLACVALYMLVADSLLTPGQMHMVQREDGLIETATAIFMLMASLLSLRIALRIGRGRPEFGMHLFLAVLFFLMCGEEISWGQRYLGLETPEFLSAVNVQNETNFHNMYGYVFDHAFILCFFLWGVAVPLLDRFSAVFRQFFLAIGLPVPSAGLGLGMFLISMMQSVVVYKVIAPFDPALPWLRLPEPREMLSGLAFFLMMVEVWVLVARPLPEPARGRADDSGTDTMQNALRRG